MIFWLVLGHDYSHEYIMCILDWTNVGSIPLATIGASKRPMFINIYNIVSYVYYIQGWK